MLAIEEDYKDEPLSLEMLLRLHEILTESTLDNPKDAGRLRSGKGDEVYVIDGQGTIYHEGPDPAFVRKELDRFIAYANESSRILNNLLTQSSKQLFFISGLHICIRLLMGYGRLARLLFYWSLLRDGYWGFMYLPPISRVTKEAHSQYGMAYVCRAGR